MRRGARARFFNLIDLVNRLEAEARAGRAGRLADQLTRVDLVVLDELGYLPFSQNGGQLLFHLISKLYSRTSVSDQHQPRLRRMAVGVRRRCQNDSRSARPADSSLRYPGNRKRKLAVQEPLLTFLPPVPCPGRPTGPSHTRRCVGHDGHSAARAGPSVNSLDKEFCNQKTGWILDADAGWLFEAD